MLQCTCSYQQFTLVSKPHLWLQQVLHVHVHVIEVHPSNVVRLALIISSLTTSCTSSGGSTTQRAHCDFWADPKGTTEHPKHGALWYKPSENTGTE